MEIIKQMSGWTIRLLVAGSAASLAACGGGQDETATASSAEHATSRVSAPATGGVESALQEARRTAELGAQAQAFAVNLGQISLTALGSLGIGSPYGLPPLDSPPSHPATGAGPSGVSALPIGHTLPCSESGFVTVSAEATPLVLPQAGQSVTLQFASCRHRSPLRVDGSLHLLLTRIDTTTGPEGSWRADIEANFDRLTMTPAGSQVAVTGRGQGQLSVLGTPSARLDLEYTGEMNLQHIAPGGRQETTHIHAAQVHSRLTPGPSTWQLASAIDLNLSSPASASPRWRLTTPDPLLQSAPGALPTAGSMTIEASPGKLLRCITLGTDHAVELRLEFSTPPGPSQSMSLNWRQLL